MGNNLRKNVVQLICIYSGLAPYVERSLNLYMTHILSIPIGIFCNT